MKILQASKSFFNNLSKTWQKGDLSKKINIGLGIASVISAPIGVLGIWSVEKLQNNKSEINLNSNSGNFLKAAAFSYPLVWTFIQGFIGLGQGIMSGSILSSTNAILALASTFIYDFLVYKILGLKIKTKEMQTNMPFHPIVNSLKADSERYTALLNLYTSLYITLLGFTGELSALPDLSPDVKKAYRIRPIDSEEQLKDFKNFWQRAKFNLGQEISAGKQALFTLFKPNEWKSSKEVNKFLKEKKAKRFLQPIIKFCSSPIPSLAACISTIFRLVSGLLFLITLPSLGLKPYKEKISDPEKQSLKSKHPMAYQAFQIAQKLKSLVMWITGFMSISMSFSLSYKEFASQLASTFQGLAGLISIGAGVSQKSISRLLTFMSSISLTFANGIRNLEGAKK